LLLEDGKTLSVTVQTTTIREIIHKNVTRNNMFFMWWKDKPLVTL